MKVCIILIFLITAFHFHVEASKSNDTIKVFFKPGVSVSPDTIKVNLKTGQKLNKSILIENRIGYEISDSCYVDYIDERNYALEFNRLNTFVDCGRDSSLIICRAITIESWIYKYDRTLVGEIIGREGGASILYRGGHEYAYSLGFYKYPELGGGRRNLKRIVGSQVDSIQFWYGENKITIFDTCRNVWQHIAGVYDEQKKLLMLYRDGKLIKVKKVENSIKSADYFNLYIGGDSAGQRYPPQSYFIVNGIIDEVRLWNTARTPAQIKTNMNRELTRPEKGLVGYWKFNEGNGYRTTDASKNINHGRISRNTRWVGSSAPVTIRWLEIDRASGIPERGSDVCISATFDASGLDSGSYSASIVSESNSSGDPSYVIPVQIHVAGSPDITILEDSISIVHNTLGQAKRKHLTICNSGFKRLEIRDIRTDNQAYNCTETTIDIEPGECKEFIIKHVPRLISNNEGNLYLDCNDPDSPLVKIPLNVDEILIPFHIIMSWVLIFILTSLFLFLIFFFWKYRAKINSNKLLGEKIAVTIDELNKKQQIIATQSRLSSLGRMAAGIAHEISQPLQNIFLSAESIQDELTEPNLDKQLINRHLTDQVKAVKNIRHIIKHIDYVSDPDTASDRDRFNINDTVRNALSMMDVQMRNRNIHILLDLEEDLPQLAGNPIEMEQVMINLLNNARDAVDEKSLQDKNPEYRKKIMVKSRIENKNIEAPAIYINIEDNGVGIDKEDLAHIFIPFYTSKKVGKGTGLGLYIAFDLLKKINGTIKVSSSVGKGTVCTVIIPAYE